MRNSSVLNIWCNSLLTGENKAILRERITDRHKIIFADEVQQVNKALSSLVGLGGNLPENTDIAFGHPDPDEAMQSENLRWVHLDSAGYTPYDRDDLKETFRRRGTLLTNSSNVHAEAVAQHILAMMLSLSRQLPRALNKQFTARSWDYTETRRASRLLNRQTALIVGYGHIARSLVRMLAPFEMNIVAVRRQVNGDGNGQIRVINEGEIERFLPVADHIVDILPSNSATANFFGASRLALVKPDAFFYNVGRGTTVDQDALLENLKNGRVAAAYLDVTDPEPLPPEHPLWSAPNCYITPHSAGGFDNVEKDLLNHFLNNFERFIGGAELLNRIV